MHVAILKLTVFFFSPAVIPDTHTVVGIRNQPYVGDAGAGSIQVCVEVLEPGVSLPFGVDTRYALISTLDGTATAPGYVYS